MKVYLATAGDYSDYRVLHVFRNREDAEAYAGTEDIDERELQEVPIEQRTWHMFWWNAGQPDSERDGRSMGNPWQFEEQRDFTGDPHHVEHRWGGYPVRSNNVLHIQGWDLDRILKVYSEQRAQHIAVQQGVS